MPSLQIRDMPVNLYESLKASADSDHRSLAQQAIVLLSSALENTSHSKSRRVRVLQEIRDQTRNTNLNDVDIVRLIREDRDR